MLGGYIHIPFCEKICTYCDFCKMYYNPKYVTSYLDSLEREIKNRYQGEVLTSLYIGGGTPSCLSLKELERLLKIVDILKKSDKCEYTIECNIENIDEEKLKLFKEYRINRISYGVQSFNSEHLKVLGRNHNLELVTKVIKMTKKYFNNISIDLIYGVTNDIEILKEDLKKYILLDIPHISCYSLIIEEHTKLYIDNKKYIDEDIDKLMFDYINEYLVNNNYKHYEISNYAKEGYESIHNKNYWLNGEYYGFGLGAVSYLNYKRISNTKNLNKYLTNKDYQEISYEDESIRKENDLILGLRLMEGINYLVFNKKYNCDIINKDCIRELIDNGYLICSGNYLKCNYQYIYVMNNILESIIGSDL